MTIMISSEVYKYLISSSTKVIFKGTGNKFQEGEWIYISRFLVR